MMKPIRVMKILSLVTTWAFLATGCAMIDRFLFGEEEDKSPEELIMDGMSDMERGRYAKATEAFQTLKDRYPYSKYAVAAEMKMADTLYEREEYDEAYEAYDEFEKLHPKNRDIPYVIYQKGMCHFRQVKSLDREQSHTLKAREEFDRLIKRFPSNEYAGRARKNIRKCLIYLAEYELYVGHFYYKRGKYRAAMARYGYILQHYPDMGQYHEALDYMARCRERLAEELAEAQENG
ncbi:MAG: outer membrane protein assembly factor BamD [Deltaproteobacteria bacterium]|nr:outer membrane protein assembly factor BamD [Deltaproteobacteria bacterium]